MKAQVEKRDSIRDEYVTGGDDVTLRGLAAKHGLHHSGVSRWSKKQGWTALRVDHRARVSREVQKKVVSREAEARLRHIEIAKHLQGKALQRLQTLDPQTLDAQELRRYLVDAIEIERKSIGINEEVVLRLKGEWESIFDRLRDSLEPDVFRRILTVLSEKLSVSESPPEEA